MHKNSILSIQNHTNRSAAAVFPRSFPFPQCSLCLRRQPKCFLLPAKGNCAVSRSASCCRRMAIAPSVEMLLAAGEWQLRRQRNAKKAFRRRLPGLFGFGAPGVVAKVLFAGVGRLAAGQAEKACPAASCRLSRLLMMDSRSRTPAARGKTGSLRPWHAKNEAARGKSTLYCPWGQPRSGGG